MPWDRRPRPVWPISISCEAQTISQGENQIIWWAVNDVSKEQHLKRRQLIFVASSVTPFACDMRIETVGLFIKFNDIWIIYLRLPRHIWILSFFVEGRRKRKVERIVCLVLQEHGGATELKGRRRATFIFWILGENERSESCGSRTID